MHSKYAVTAHSKSSRHASRGNGRTWNVAGHFAQNSCFLFRGHRISLSLGYRFRALDIDHTGAFRKVWIVCGNAVFDGKAVPAMRMGNLLGQIRSDDIRKELTASGSSC